MGFKDVREWIDKLEYEGELKRIKVEVDWNRELGAVARKAADKNGPALLFENIKDYKDTRCRKLYVGGLAASRRVALMLGLPKDSHPRDMIQTTRQRLKDLIKPMIVNTGPVKENIVKGDAVDLYQFPVPFLHHMDGGRFFTTSCACVTKDPETGTVNVGTYRGMMVGKDRIAMGGLHPGNHGGQQYLKYQKMGVDMPMSVVFSCDPAIKYVGSAGVPSYICEYDVMGGIRQEPVTLVKCETSDLEVPAWAEMVIEGTVLIDPGTYEWEGPFGEYTGYYGGEKTRRPVFKVNCITHRDDPIYTTSMEGWGPGHPNETGTMCQITVSATAWNALEAAGVPGVKDVYALPASAVVNVAVQIHKTYLGQAKQVAMALWGSGLPMWVCKNVIVVDDDIDIHNFEALEWAIAYRVNPGENDIVTVPGAPGPILDPSIRMKDRDRRLGAAKCHRLLIDATKNWEYEPQEQYGGDIYPPVAFLLDPEDEALVERRWREYGLD